MSADAFFGHGKLRHGLIIQKGDVLKEPAMLTVADSSPSQVGFGGSGGSGGGGRNRRARGTESPGSAFQMFLGGNGGTADDAGAGEMGSGDGGERGRGLRIEESPDGATVPAHPLPVRGASRGTRYFGFGVYNSRRSPEDFPPLGCRGMVEELSGA